MDILDIIETKKHGGKLGDEELAWVAAEFTADRLPAYQMAAFLMAVRFVGLDAEETMALTAAMIASGEELATDGLGAFSADKHSTGGVGDKVSLLLAPLAAACGLSVPMLSGRGLGHTGGTLDKLEAVPGYRIHLDNAEFLRTVKEVGCAIIGQSANIAPADGKIYALRDVTGTVDSVPLITASIMSKKLAAGPRTIVIDLKCGSGAFMTDLERARELAQSLVAIGRHWGRHMAVLFTDMSQPLGQAIGHAMEAVEAFAALRPGGRRDGPADLVRLTEELVAAMAATAGLCPDGAAALALVREVWDSGAALAKLEEWLAAQGATIATEREDFGLRVAPEALVARAPRGGYLQAIDCRQVGLSLVAIGGARRRVEDPLDLSSGIRWLPALGDRLEKGDPVAVVHADDGDAAAAVAERLLAAITIGPDQVPVPPLILDRLS